MDELFGRTIRDSGHGEVAELLSIDADAHLQKLGVCMFPTPAQLPVELVRAALKRRASSVTVYVRRGRLVVDDDGEGIAGRQWLELACALNAGRNAVDREKAIDSLQSAASPGIGMLSVFVPGARSIRIENSSLDGQAVMHVSAGRVRLFASSARSRGTRITVVRHSGPAAIEQKLLKELCAAVPQDITVNGRKIERKALLRRTLVQQNVDLGTGRSPALVAVPAQGDVCRIWLMDQRIPWQAFTSAAYHGLVFEAALETASLPSGPEFVFLAKAAGRLYQWLAANYLSFPEKYQERIEDLLFKKARLAGDLQLFSVFSPFRLWRSRRRLNLEEVRRRAERNILYALPVGSDPDRFLGRHHEALLLTPLQKDFLLNHLGLPLVTPAASMTRQGKFSRMFFSARRKTSRLLARLPRPAVRRAAAGSASGEEKLLCREMENFWARSQRHVRPSPESISLSVIMADGRGLAPAVWVDEGRNHMLLLRRRHPLVVMAARSVARDHANAELAFAALAPEHSLTAAVQ
jgi:hypothetical protein